MKQILLLSIALLALPAYRAIAQSQPDPYGSNTPGSYNNSVMERNKAVRDAERVKSPPNTPGAGSGTGTNSKEYRKAVGESETGKAWQEILHPTKSAAELEKAAEHKTYEQKLRR